VCVNLITKYKILIHLLSNTNYNFYNTTNAIILHDSIICFSISIQHRFSTVVAADRKWSSGPVVPGVTSNDQNRLSRSRAVSTHRENSRAASLRTLTSGLQPPGWNTVEIDWFGLEQSESVVGESLTSHN